MPSTTARGATDRRLLWILASVLAIVVLLLVAALSRPASSAPAASEPAASPSAQHDAANPLLTLARRIEGDPTAIGSVDAPVVLIEFGDYRCPFCGVHARQTLPALIEEYVDTGFVRVERRDVPIFGEESFDAAVAARAAGEQDLYWEYSSAIYAYEGGGHQPLPRERLLELAREIGVPDMAAFEAGLDDSELVAAVAHDAQEAQSIGLQSTPTFVVGGTPVLGAQPLEEFRQVIDDELARAGW